MGNKSVVICKYKCNRANIFTGAQAKCAKTGGKKGQWKYINFQKANCHPCTEDPNKTFPIPGNGEWKCKEGINTRCSIKCPNNDTPVNKGTISCHHIKSLNKSQTKKDDWIPRVAREDDASNPSWTCVQPVYCQKEDMEAALMDLHVNKRGFPYTYNEDDWIMRPPSKSCLLSAHRRCTTDPTKRTNAVSICCKGKNGKNQWKFKGNPSRMPKSAKC